MLQGIEFFVGFHGKGLNPVGGGGAADLAREVSPLFTSQGADTV